MDNFYEEIKESGIGRIEENISIKKYTTYKVGGTAKYLVYPKSTEKLVLLMKIIKKYNLKYKILGNGSNLLFSDNFYDGVLIKLESMDNIEILGNKIIVEAGFPLMKLSRIAAKNSLTGLEFASGIPGTVGGAIFMNAGAYKSDMGYVVQSIKVLTPNLRIIELENRELDFHYRTSYLKKHKNYICLQAVLKLRHGSKDSIEELMKSRLKRRMESQPLNYPSAGSVFRNPPGLFSGELIEKLGLKGKKYGGAMISDKHANFIVNYKNAKATDIKYLIELVQKKVKEEYNIDMVAEQEFVNW